MSNVTASPSSQINKENGSLEASRIMNLYQFIQLYRDITSQAAEVLSAEGAIQGPSGQLPSTGSCQASMWMGRSVTWSLSKYFTTMWYFDIKPFDLNSLFQVIPQRLFVDKCNISCWMQALLDNTYKGFVSFWISCVLLCF